MLNPVSLYRISLFLPPWHMLATARSLEQFFRSLGVCWLSRSAALRSADHRKGGYLGTERKMLGPIVIGNETVIGANAVVVTDIPDHCVAVGVPARVIKRSVNVSTVLYHRRRKESQCP